MISLSPPLRKTVATIKTDPQMNDAILELTKRGDMPKETATLAGIAINPLARDQWNRDLDQMWASPVIGKRSMAAEIIVGGGVHAAIYAANRVALGHPKPVVLEAKSRAGGIFAISDRPSFYLNSRNRPGPLGLPSMVNNALNVMPNCPVQPSDISGSEFQRNSDLAFVVRTALALNADVYTDAKVAKLEPFGVNADQCLIATEDGHEWITSRVVLATGLNTPDLRVIAGLDANPRIIDYRTFMARFDKPFPLRDLGRVAVIGAGDSGRTVIEALTGKGPSTQMSVATLDWVKEIDWYGVGATTTCTKYQENNRSRYKSISGLLPDTGRTGRVTPYAKAQRVETGAGCVYVNGRVYDNVIICTGLVSDALITTNAVSVFGLPNRHSVGNRIVANRYGSNSDPVVYAIGPLIDIDVTELERNSTPAFTQAPENRTALFRYADRTASLAQALPRTQAPKALPKGQKAAKKEKTAATPTTEPVRLTTAEAKEYGLNVDTFPPEKGGCWYILGSKAKKGANGEDRVNAYGQYINTASEFDQFKPNVPVAFPSKAKTKSAKTAPELSEQELRKAGLEWGGASWRDNARGLRVNTFGQIIGKISEDAYREPLKKKVRTFQKGVPISYGPYADAQTQPTKKAKAKPKKPKRLDSLNRTQLLDIGLIFGGAYYRRATKTGRVVGDDKFNAYGQQVSYPEDCGVYKPGVPQVYTAEVTTAAPKPKRITTADAKRKELKINNATGFWYDYTNPKFKRQGIDDNARINVYGQLVRSDQDFNTYYPGQEIIVKAGDPPRPLTQVEARNRGVKLGSDFYGRKNRWTIRDKGKIVRLNRWGQRMDYFSEFGIYYPRRRKVVSRSF